MRELNQQEIDSVHGGDLTYGVSIGPFSVSGTAEDWSNAMNTPLTTPVPANATSTMSVWGPYIYSGGGYYGGYYGSGM